MFEKVNPQHPDKVVDRMAGAIVDYVYRKTANNSIFKHVEPRVAVEGTVGHGKGFFVIETSVELTEDEIIPILERFVPKKSVDFSVTIVEQNQILADNQKDGLKCGDNGIFKAFPVADEEMKLTDIARKIYNKYHSDGKYVLDGEKLIICQAAGTLVTNPVEGEDHEECRNVKDDLRPEYPTAIINPLGEWEGGLEVDSGAVNRKLGSDMGRSITGGGLHGKDLTKADVSVNIYAFIKAQMTRKPVEISCAIGDSFVDGRAYSDMVEIARQYIRSIGGFEKFAEWGLLR